MARLHKGHRDPTADLAFGKVNKEWQLMASLAVDIREGRGHPNWTAEQLKKFTGIYKRLLEDPIDEVRKQAGR